MQLAHSVTEPTLFQVVTLVIAIVGAILGVVSTVWAVIAWRLTGSYVRVKTYRGIAVPDTSVDIIGVTAMNVGRTVVAVDGWGFELPDKKTIPGHAFAPSWGGPTMPHKLDPGHSQSWNFPLDQIRQTLAEENYPRGTNVRPFVTLGTGQRKLADAVEIS